MSKIYKSIEIERKQMIARSLEVGKQDSDCPWVWVSFWGAANIPKLDSGGGYTTL